MGEDEWAVGGISMSLGRLCRLGLNGGRCALMSRDRSLSIWSKHPPRQVSGAVYKSSCLAITLVLLGPLSMTSRSLKG
jgi:hypothetical protein